MTQVAPFIVVGAVLALASARSLNTLVPAIFDRIRLWKRGLLVRNVRRVPQSTWRTSVPVRHGLGRVSRGGRTIRRTIRSTPLSTEQYVVGAQHHRLDELPRGLT